MIEWYDLNARHEATFLWLGGFVIWAFVKSGAVRESIRHLLNSFIRPIVLVPILGLFIVATGLAAVAVTFGRIVGLWEILPVISVAVWGVTSGERWFGLLTEKQLRRGVHQSSGELEAAIYRYLDVTNEDPKPFVWTKTADQIPASVARFCRRILDTGHLYYNDASQERDLEDFFMATCPRA